MGSRLAGRTTKYLALTVLMLATLLGLALAGTAQASEYVQPYPSYTHYTNSGGTETAVDPLNAVFGGTYLNGYFGTPGGLLEQLQTDLGSGIHNDDLINVLQYVKFQSNYGNYQWRNEQDTYQAPYNTVYSVRYGSTYGANIHTRLFRNPYATSSGSYANKNTVTAIHHEHWTGLTHVIDEDWETTEDNYLYTLSLEPGNTWWNDNIYNGGESMQGWYSNGWMGKATLYP